MSDDNFLILKLRDFYDIFDGDSKFYDYADKKYGLPYLSGYMLMNLCREFGIVDCEKLQGCSRWVYVENLLQYYIDNNNVDKLFNWLFDKKRYIEYRKDEKITKLNVFINDLIINAIEEINDILQLSDKKLTTTNNKYFITDVNNDRPLIMNKNCISNDYINKLVALTDEDIYNNRFDSVITKSRTLIEEVLIEILEKKNIVPNDSGNINRLYQQVKDVLKLNVKDFDELNSKRLIGALETIINSIAELRNNNSDSHGVGSRRIEININTAKLVRDSTRVLCNYLLDISV